MRLILSLIFLLVTSILSIPLYLIEVLIGLFSYPLEHRIAQAITVAAFRVWIFISGSKVTVTGLENIPKDGPVEFVANHRGYFDILVLYSYIPKQTFIVAKKELRLFPCINLWMMILKCHFLDRNDVRGSVEIIKKGVQQVKDGMSVFIMPEGTRNKGEGLLEFHEGSFKYAQRTGCPVVPAIMTGTAEVLEQQAPWIKKSNITLDFLPPVYPDQLDKEDRKRMGQYVHDLMEPALAERCKKIAAEKQAKK